MTIYRIYHCKDRASEEFLNSLHSFGRPPEIICGYCDRHHIATSEEYNTNYSNSVEYGNLEFEKAPDKVVLHTDSDGVAIRHINNMSIVVDCPCNGLKAYEEFIWNEKDSIRTYLKDRIDLEFRLAQEQLTINVLKGIK